MNELLFLIESATLFAVTRFLVRFGQPALLVWFSFLVLAANLFVSKEITLFGLVTTAADSYVVGAFFALNYLQIYFGQAQARAALLYAFFLQIAFLLLSQIHLSFIPSPQDQMQGSFETVFSLYPRVVGASLIAFFLSQRLDLALLTPLRERYPIRGALLATMAISQTVDTLLFSFLAFWGHISEMGGLIFISLIIKGILLLVSALFMGGKDVDPIRATS